MASRDPFTDPFAASRDSLGLSLHARPSLSLSRGRPTAPYEGETLFPEVGREPWARAFLLFTGEMLC